MNVNARRACAAAALSGAAVLVLGGPASAGEITGSGKPVVVNGTSECAYSGLNDDTVEEPGKVQSFGQIVKMAGPMGGIPGMFCNPTGKRAG